METVDSLHVTPMVDTPPARPASAPARRGPRLQAAYERIVCPATELPADAGLVAASVSHPANVAPAAAGKPRASAASRDDGHPDPALTARAPRHATTPRRATRDIVIAARAQLPAPTWTLTPSALE